MVELELESMQFDSRACILESPLDLASLVGREDLLMGCFAEHEFYS